MDAHYGPVFPPKLTGKGEPKQNMTTSKKLMHSIDHIKGY